MTRPKTDADATKRLSPEDETQEADEGTKVGLLQKSKVLADFKRIVSGKKD